MQDQDRSHGPAPSGQPLPPGCCLFPLTTRPDARGDLTEVLRAEWFDTPLPTRWQAIRSKPNALRGTYLQCRAWSYVCLLSGGAIIGLHDLRPNAPDARTSALLRLTGGQRQVMVIPPGVAHGLYFPEAALYLIGTGGDAGREPLRCRWDCPELGLAWPCRTPLQEPADRNAGDYAALLAHYAAGIAAESPAGSTG